MNQERDIQMKGYWAKKAENKEKAKEWTLKMEEENHDLIQIAVKESVIYSSDYKFKENTKQKTTSLDVYNFVSQHAVFHPVCQEGKTAVLNFASYKNPGGKFIDGSSAQEESLCHNSFLYNILKEKQDYYDENKKHLCKGAYTNRAIYSPNVKFYHPFVNAETGKRDTKEIDVITCAAPNFSVARYGMLSKEENSKALDSRIEFVLKIAKENNVNNLILGAYGCGVFAQDPKEVAEIFKKHLQNYHFDNVLFAIPMSDNFMEFSKVFHGYTFEKGLKVEKDNDLEVNNHISR